LLPQPTPQQQKQKQIKKVEAEAEAAATEVIMPNASEIAEDVHERVHSGTWPISLGTRVQLTIDLVNPFLTQSSYSRNSVIAYRITTTISWLVLLITSIFYTFSHPHEGRYSRHTIWGQNYHRHTPFALNSVIVSLYWYVPLANCPNNPE